MIASKHNRSLTVTPSNSKSRFVRDKLRNVYYVFFPKNASDRAARMTEDIGDERTRHASNRMDWVNNPGTILNTHIMATNIHFECFPAQATPLPTTPQEKHFAKNNMVRQTTQEDDLKIIYHNETTGGSKQRPCGDNKGEKNKNNSGSNSQSQKGRAHKPPT